MNKSSNIFSAFMNYPNAEALTIHMTESGIFSYEERLAALLNWQPGMPLTSIITDAKKLNKWINFYNERPFTSYLEQYDMRNIIPICLTDAKYPLSLKEIYQPPIVLFAQGDLALLNTPSLSVVGSRTMSNYGFEALKLLLPDLAKSLTIISGLAQGVDVTAHQLTMVNGGKTIAVIGTGLASTYPRHHAQLQQLIAQEQLLLSPLPLWANIQKWHFVYRNRTIAGLSHGTLVVEAANRSGSLITANYALQENREVYCIPGPITSDLSTGTNALIQAGAKLVKDSEDIMEDYTFF